MSLPHPGIPVPAEGDFADAFRRWQGHVDAGRLGANPPCPPEIAANRAATDALFRTFPRQNTHIGHRRDS